MQLFINIKSFFDSKLGPLGKRVVGGASWAVAGTIASKVLVFVATILVTRIMTKEVYGELSIIRSTIQMFVSLSAFGIGATATKFIAQYRQSDPHKAVRMYLVANIFVITMAVIASLILFSTADVLATSRLHNPELSTDIKIAGIILFFTLLNGAQIGTLSGFEDFKRIAVCNLIMGISEIILLCCGAYFFGLTGAVVGFGVTYGIAWAYNTIYIRSHLKKFGISVYSELKNISSVDLKPLLTFSLPVAATSWIQAILYWWQKTSVVNGAGFENLANYDVAEQWKSQLAFVPMILANVMLPVLSNVNDDKKSRRSVIKLNFKLNVAITSILAVIICFLGKYILMLYGPEYNNLIPLYLLCICAVFGSISQMCGTIFMSSDKSVYGVITSLTFAVTLFFIFTYFSTFELALENVLAAAILCATVLQALASVLIIKFKHLF